MVWKGDDGRRLAQSLITLIDEVDAAYPGRDKRNDGSIGDKEHEKTDSDHNAQITGPNGEKVVTALDITHDPPRFDAQAFAENLRLKRDRRIKYVIHNGRIFNSTVSPWIWRDRGKGPGDHTEHVHVSVMGAPALYDNDVPWPLAGDVPEHIYPVSVPMGIQRGIIATTFGGSGEDEPSAYDGHLIGDNEMGVALPYRFVGARPKVRVAVAHLGLSAIGDIIDVGPWNIADPYWVTGRRPQAESGTDLSGRKTNMAGIDLTPAMSRALGRASNDKFAVDWEFVTTAPPPKPLPPPDPVVIPPPPPGPTPMPNTVVDDCIADLNVAMRPILTKYLASNDGGAAAVRAELIRMLGGIVPTAQALPPPVPAPAPLPAPGTAPPADPPQTPAGSPKPIEKPSVQLSAVALAISTALQAAGVIGTPGGMGEEPTMAGTLATLIPILTGSIGLTGFWGTAGKFLVDAVKGATANVKKQ